ncbi:G-protein coupled receptor Mth2-like isoform X2 [Sitodiplosis mosellana]|uniref:G-protein coupled receptor Mth2-like isoform X2 n=1 Tax=Sitodiplosis mosellana TaxID=263140 RepID=UPI002443A05B|nr:G-protein coupled receptor Mth2-like isoform X2 [Sitodiplosis mosellana]
MLRLWLIVLMIPNMSVAFLFGKELPCHFYDSINITDGASHSNGSITFNGLEFPFNQYAKIVYSMENGTKPIKVKPYIRGCLCNIRPCLRLCCPYGSFVNENTTELGVACHKNEAAKNIQSQIIDDNNQTNIVNLNEHFAYIERICKHFTIAEDFKVYKNGSISHGFGSVERIDYCVAITSGPNNEILSQGNLCKDQHKKIGSHSIGGVIATYFYASIPELRNFHGKCFLCFVALMIIFYMIQPWTQVIAWHYVEPPICRTIASILYSLILSLSLWLNVISFHLWKTFKSPVSTVHYSETKRLFLCFLYAHGLPCLLLTTGHILDSIESVPYYVKPGFGGSTGCFLKNDWTSKLIFYSLPLVLIFSTNGIFFILIAIKIRETKRHLRNVLSLENSKQTIESMEKETANLLLFLRLFILMGLTGIMESISVFKRWGPYFLFSDILNSAQGIIIFALFVLQPRVLRLIQKRWFMGKNGVCSCQKSCSYSSTCCD